MSQTYEEDKPDNDDLSPEDRASIVKAIIDTKFGSSVDEEDVDHVSGVTCMDSKNDIIIGDHTIPDWFTSYKDTSTMPDRVKYYTWWRVDPLHNFSLALVSCADGSKPALESFVSGEIQYELSEATDLIRIMSYADIYLDNSACTGAITEPIDILNRSLGFGGLILACTELWRATSGLTLLDLNRISSTWKITDPQMREMLAAVTNGFVITSPNTTTTAWTDTTFKILKVIRDSLGVTDDNWEDHWYGGVVPWWYVQAVSTKFGGEVVVKTKDPVSVQLNVDEEWLDEEEYHIKADVAPATDLSVLTSSIAYEKKGQRKALPYFTILTPTKDGYNMKVHWTSWYYNFVNDLPKSGIRRRMKVVPLEFDGVIE